jgi:hypothetical protein
MRGNTQQMLPHKQTSILSSEENVHSLHLLVDKKKLASLVQDQSERKFHWLYF